MRHAQNRIAPLALLTVLAVTPAYAQRTTLNVQAAPAALNGDRQGMSRERLARVAPAMKKRVDDNVFPGAVTLIARRGEIVHLEAHGFKDQAKTQPMAKDSLFRLASMTKPIVSVATMMLVERGEMSLHQPISLWLPELKDMKVETRRLDKDGKEEVVDVPAAREITVQDLLRHTSGLVYSGRTKSPRIKEMYEKAGIEARVADISGDDMLKALGKIPLANQPGTVWEYSISTDVLGLLIERVAKKPLDALLKEMLLDPLGMKDTSFVVPDAKLARLAEAFDADPQKAAMMKSYRITEAQAGKTYFKGGAGLVSTAEDYVKFAQMVLNGGEYGGRRFLSRKTVETMLANHIVGINPGTLPSTQPGHGFGLGWAVRLDDGMGFAAGSKGDAAWGGAWGTGFWIDPKEGLVGIVMTQAPSPGTDTRLLMRNLAYGALVK